MAGRRAHGLGRAPLALHQHASAERSGAVGVKTQLALLGLAEGELDGHRPAADQRRDACFDLVPRFGLGVTGLRCLDGRWLGLGVVGAGDQRRGQGDGAEHRAGDGTSARNLGVTDDGQAHRDGESGSVRVAHEAALDRGVPLDAERAHGQAHGAAKVAIEVLAARVVLDAPHAAVCARPGLVVDRVDGALAHASATARTKITDPGVVAERSQRQVLDVGVDRVDAQPRAAVRADQQAVVADGPEPGELGEVRVVRQPAEGRARVAGEPGATQASRDPVRDRRQTTVALGDLEEGLEARGHVDRGLVHLDGDDDRVAAG